MIKLFYENYFEVIDEEAKSYWLGFLAADGCVSDDNIVSVNLGIKDANHLLRFRDAILLNTDIKATVNEEFNTESVHLAVKSEKMASDLIYRGITPRKSFTLEPPWDLPRPLLHHWVRGYFDGDGSAGRIRKKNKRTKKITGIKIRASITSTASVLDFISLQVIGYKKRLYDKGKKGNIFTKGISFSSKVHVRMFYDYIYKDANIYLERKKNNFDRYMD